MALLTQDQDTRESEIRVCSQHEKSVPLLWTFKFDGSEYWCPYCGWNGGMMGAGTHIPSTPELEEYKAELLKEAETFLSSDSDAWDYKGEVE